MGWIFRENPKVSGSFSLSTASRRWDEAVTVTECRLIEVICYRRALSVQDAKYFNLTAFSFYKGRIDFKDTVSVLPFRTLTLGNLRSSLHLFCLIQMVALMIGSFGPHKPVFMVLLLVGFKDRAADLSFISKRKIDLLKTIVDFKPGGKIKS